MKILFLKHAAILPILGYYCSMKSNRVVGFMGTRKPDESQGARLLRQLFLRGNRIFNMQNASAAATLEKIPHNQLGKILSNLAKHKRVLRLRRGLYVSVGWLSEEPDTHPFVISAYLIQPSAISHWSALQHHGLTEQIPHIITASTPKKIVTPSMREKQHAKTKHIWKIDELRYEYINVQQKHFFGIEKLWLGEYFQVNITDKERTLLDVFIYPKMFGGIGEALGILENSLAVIDTKKLINYAIQYDKKSLAKRLGWALEYFGVPTKQLEQLLKVPINYYCRLDPSAPAKGSCDKRWMIQNNLIKVENK
ncbi:MAG TPA: type IV toxin-antitoxin system AbiEi family antitoxin [Gammaproteobacteria bacterium]|nr:type IV toxin-antitoxin system AbiEi family antitoxin [Gammaproteobacteria bacterium]